MKRNLSDIKIDYNGTPLNEEGLPTNPLDLFDVWFQEASATFNTQPNAMTLTTHGTNGFPQARVVLLKSYSDQGFIFYSNYKSQKGIAIVLDNRVSINFYWPELERQVRIEGYAEKLSDEESNRYFNSRPLESRLSAIASNQSQRIASRAELEEKIEKLREAYKEGAPKRPSYWGGYIIKPVFYEFWQGRPNRLHDRIIYHYGSDGDWKTARIAP